MATAQNSKTKKEVKKALLSYLEADHDNKELKKLTKFTPDELAEINNLLIIAHHNNY